MNDIAIIIPARYASTRFPGKPLAKIAGVEMLRRVAAIARSVARQNPGCRYAAAIDDERVASFCTAYGIPAVMTAESCRSGTERCLDAVRQMPDKPGLVINLQGDNPLCPPHVLQALIDAWRAEPADVYTPCVHLDWAEYDALLASKRETPFSGTTVLVDNAGNALAFSKAVIPAIRDRSKAEAAFARSPVRRHIGLYAYTFDALERYFRLPESVYERGCVEGLEQMRFLENGMRVKMVEVDYRGRRTTSGVDSPEDIARVEAVLAEFGEPDLS